MNSTFNCKVGGTFIPSHKKVPNLDFDVWPRGERRWQWFPLVVNVPHRLNGCRGHDSPFVRKCIARQVTFWTPTLADFSYQLLERNLVPIGFGDKL